MDIQTDTDRDRQTDTDRDRQTDMYTQTEIQSEEGCLQTDDKLTYKKKFSRFITRKCVTCVLFEAICKISIYFLQFGVVIGRLWNVLFFLLSLRLLLYTSKTDAMDRAKTQVNTKTNSVAHKLAQGSRFCPYY